MRKRIIVLLSSVVAIGAITNSVYSINDGTITENPNEEIKIITREERQVEMEEEKQREKNKIVVDASEGPDLELRAKREKVEKEEIELQKKDVKAYKVVKKYNKNSKEVKELIRDYSEDCKMVEMMCDILENSEVSAEELDLLKSYLNRRYDWMEDTNELKLRIEEVLGL